MKNRVFEFTLVWIVRICLISFFYFGLCVPTGVVLSPFESHKAQFDFYILNLSFLFCKPNEEQEVVSSFNADHNPLLRSFSVLIIL